MEKGYVHVYMGKNWKDLKTAQGMALRACGAGFSVGFYNFGEEIDDIKSLESRLPRLRVLTDKQQDISEFDMIILYDCKLVDDDTLQKILAGKPDKTEIVMCGTNFSKDMLAMADLVSGIVTLTL